MKHLLLIFSCVMLLLPLHAQQNLVEKSLRLARHREALPKNSSFQEVHDYVKALNGGRSRFVNTGNLDREKTKEELAKETKDSLIALNLHRFFEDPWRDDVDMKLLDGIAKANRRSSLFDNRDISQLPPPPSPVNFATKFIDGTAQFVAKRFKEELMLTFFDGFEEQLDSSNVFSALFPETHQMLSVQDAFDFNTIGETFKAAFRSDLENMLYNFENYIRENPEYDELEMKPEFRTFLIAAKVVDLSRKDYSALEIMQVLNLQEGEIDDELGKAIRVSHTLMNCVLEDVPTKEGYVTQVMSLRDYLEINTEIEREFFAALIYQYNPHLADDIISNETEFKRDFRALNRDLQGFIIQMNNLRTQHQGLHNVQENGPIPASAVFDYIESVLGLLDASVKLYFFQTPEKYWKSDFKRHGVPLSRNVLKAARAVEQKEYGEALLVSTGLVSQMILLANEDDPERVDELRRNLMLYGNFMVNVINAETAEEIRDAIESVALPVGSSRIKKYSKMSIGLNTYPGAYVGGEWLLQGESLGDLDATFGITAPIGLAFNWGLSRKLDHYDESIPSRKQFKSEGKWRELRGTSITLFLSAIDLGAVVSYRLSDEPNRGLPQNISFRQVLAPGLFVAYGLKDMPISIVAGAQYTPNLRTVRVQGLEIQENTIQATVSVAVDIPMFNFYVKPFKR